MRNRSDLPRLLLATRYGDAERWRNLVVSGISWLAAILFVITTGFMITTPESAGDARNAARKHLILWAIVPPAWFWIEHHLIWQTAPKDLRGDFDQFKHSQELSRNIWLAFVATLGGLYFRL